MHLVITIAVAVAAAAAKSSATPVVEERCEEIVVPMCKGIGYNRTRFPNAFNQVSLDFQVERKEGYANEDLNKHLCLLN